MTINWFPGHMAKARREIESNLKKVDVVIEITDARIPYSSKNPMMDKIVQNKPRIVVLNKMDLADPKETNRWITKLKELGVYPIALNSRETNILKKIEPIAREATQDIFDRMLARGIKPRPIRAMIVGIPNVGKSTFINSMARRKSAKTGNTPGVTKTQQWIKAGSIIELLDTPGVLWPKFEDQTVGLKLSLTGAIKDTVVPLDEVAIYGINYLIEEDKETFNSFYKINNYDEADVLSIYDAIGISRGMKLRGNEIDYEAVTNRVIHDIRNGTIGRYTFDKVEILDED